jgi:pyruvate/2-oxoglutarate dehydrogenase complex dihydrolipoamide acyltransferase (E2) component
MTDTNIDGQPAGETTHKLRGMRAMIAKHMQASLQNAAQLTYHADADVSALLADRQRRKESGTSLSPEVYIIKAVSNALLVHPEFNGVSEQDHYRLIGAHNIALAVSVPGGLVTVTIRNVQDLSLEQIAEQRQDLLQRAQGGQLKPADMKDGTFTISNLGLRPIRYFTPILNAGQIAILGLGTTQQVPVFDESGHIVAQHQLPLSLTTDHRIVDGDPSGAFLAQLILELAQV